MLAFANAEIHHIFSFGRAYLKLVIGSVGQPMICSKNSLH
jgi:hypothetical protein